MPDATPDPDPSKSGKFKAVTPKAGQSVATKIDVQEGTREHTIVVEQVPAGQGEEQHQPERRRQQTGTQVNVQPSAAGLTGTWAAIANLSGVGVVFILVFLLYRDSKADQREYAAQQREDRLSERSQDQAANAAIIGAVTSLASKIDARDVKLETAIEEARLARAEVRVALAEQRQLHQEMLAVLKSIRDKGGMEPEEAVAPMPRSKVIGAG